MSACPTADAGGASSGAAQPDDATARSTTTPRDVRLSRFTPMQLIGPKDLAKGILKDNQNGRERTEPSTAIPIPGHKRAPSESFHGKYQRPEKRIRFNDVGNRQALAQGYQPRFKAMYDVLSEDRVFLLEVSRQYEKAASDTPAPPDTYGGSSPRDSPTDPSDLPERLCTFLEELAELDRQFLSVSASSAPSKQAEALAEVLKSGSIDFERRSSMDKWLGRSCAQSAEKVESFITIASPGTLKGEEEKGEGLTRTLRSYWISRFHAGRSPLHRPPQRKLLAPPTRSQQESSRPSPAPLAAKHERGCRLRTPPSAASTILSNDISCRDAPTEVPSFPSVASSKKEATPRKRGRPATSHRIATRQGLKKRRAAHTPFLPSSDTSTQCDAPQSLTPSMKHQSTNENVPISGSPATGGANLLKAELLTDSSLKSILVIDSDEGSTRSADTKGSTNRHDGNLLANAKVMGGSIGLVAASPRRPSTATHLEHQSNTATTAAKNHASDPSEGSPISQDPPTARWDRPSSAPLLDSAKKMKGRRSSSALSKKKEGGLPPTSPTIKGAGRPAGVKGRKKAVSGVQRKKGSKRRTSTTTMTTTVPLSSGVVGGYVDVEKVLSHQIAPVKGQEQGTKLHWFKCKWKEQPLKRASSVPFQAMLPSAENNSCGALPLILDYLQGLAHSPANLMTIREVAGVMKEHTDILQPRDRTRLHALIRRAGVSSTVGDVLPVKEAKI